MTDTSAPAASPVNPDESVVTEVTSGEDTFAETSEANPAAAPKPRRRRTRNPDKAEQFRADIIRASRSIMSQQRELTLRSVAAELGVSAPALYRYVDSMAQLMNLVATACIREVIDTVSVEVAAGPQHPLLRLMTALVHSRAWALRNPEEYLLTYTTVPAKRTSATTAQIDRGRVEIETELQWLYAQDFIKVLTEYNLVDSSDARISIDVPSSVAEMFTKISSNSVMRDAPGMEPWMLWKFERFYAMFYGIVQLEVTGRVPDDVVRSGSLVLYSLFETLEPNKFGDMADQAVQYTQNLITSVPTGR